MLWSSKSCKTIHYSESDFEPLQSLAFYFAGQRTSVSYVCKFKFEDLLWIRFVPAGNSLALLEVHDLFLSVIPAHQSSKTYTNKISIVQGLWIAQLPLLLLAIEFQNDPWRFSNRMHLSGFYLPSSSTISPSHHHHHHLTITILLHHLTCPASTILLRGSWRRPVEGQLQCRKSRSPAWREFHIIRNLEII